MIEGNDTMGSSCIDLPIDCKHSVWLIPAASVYLSFGFLQGVINVFFKS